MRNIILLATVLLLSSVSLHGQEDSLSIADIEYFSNSSLKAKEVLIDLDNYEEVELALKKIHTYKYLESIIIEGAGDETSLKKLFYRLSILKGLKKLTLRENELDKIPDNISSLNTLHTITIEGNSGMDYNDLCTKLKGIPLSHLNLIDNDLKKAPANISQITSLKKLQITGSNQLDYFELVEHLSKLPWLNTLSIPVNYITELPKNIDKLKSLQVLDVSNNSLMELPSEISGLKAINNLSIQGNLLLNPVKDLEKLKGNNIQYLSLDKEINSDELEKIKKMFPGAEIDFPISEFEFPSETSKSIDTKTETTKPVYTGELKAKKEAVILSGAYAFYPAFFQGVVYSMDTLNFEERYGDLRYANTYQIVNNRTWRAGSFCFRKTTHKYEQRPSRKENWFRLAMDEAAIAINYPELRAFGGMYWVYKGDLNKKQFKKKFIGKKRKRKKWNDVRIEYDKNNSLFVFTVKSDTGFTKFTAYPKIANIPIERSQQTYHRRYLMYKKSVYRRSQKFNKALARDKNRFDINYKRLREYAWKELQMRMSDEEKSMSKEDWFDYYDNIIANEKKALDNSALLQTYISRSLVIRGYSAVGNATLMTTTASKGYRFKNFKVDFTDANTGDKLAVSTITILDNKNKLTYQTNGTLGLMPNDISIPQFSSFSLLLELRGGNWAVVTASEIDKETYDPAKTYEFKATVFDKNLDVIGDLLKNLKK